MDYNNIGFIGSGKMAGAIIKGLIKTGFTSSNNTIATQAEKEGLEEKSKALGIEIILDNTQLVQKSDVIFIAVKPNQVLGVLEEIKFHSFNCSRNKYRKIGNKFTSRNKSHPCDAKYTGTRW